MARKQRGERRSSRRVPRFHHEAIADSDFVDVAGDSSDCMSSLQELCRQSRPDASGDTDQRDFHDVLLSRFRRVDRYRPAHQSTPAVVVARGAGGGVRCAAAKRCYNAPADRARTRRDVVSRQGSFRR